jgi:hypothetical protein
VGGTLRRNIGDGPFLDVSSSNTERCSSAHTLTMNIDADRLTKGA